MPEERPIRDLSLKTMTIMPVETKQPFEILNEIGGMPAPARKEAEHSPEEPHA